MLSEDTAQVQNVLLLQEGVAEGDVVRFTTDAEGRHWAVERVEASGNCTIRVLPVPAGPLDPSAQAVHERLSPFGPGGEVFSDEFPLVAFNAPAASDLAGIKSLLVHGVADGCRLARPPGPKPAPRRRMTSSSKAPPVVVRRCLVG